MSIEPQVFTFRSKDGLLLTGERAGATGAPSVILMHGGGQTRHSWGGAMRELARRGYYVINLDARGHGDSEWAESPEHYGLKFMADDLLRIIEQLPNAPVLIGASMGGLTALQCIVSAQHRLAGPRLAGPRVASGLVLVDVVPRIERQGAERILRFMNANPDGFATIEEAAEAVAQYNPHRPRPRNVHGLMKNLRKSDDGRLRWHWDPKFTQSVRGDGDPRDLGWALQHSGHFVEPALLVRGMHSDIVSDEGVAELKACLPQLEVFDVAAAGHMIAGDRNDIFNLALLDFLDRHFKPGAAP
jgi:pimeloyl-ACP methyl ester carboxylesterase